MTYYAINKGRQIGIYSTWDETTVLIQGFSNAKFKKFNNKEDALMFAAAGNFLGNTKQLVNLALPSINKILNPKVVENPYPLPLEISLSRQIYNNSIPPIRDDLRGIIPNLLSPPPRPISQPKKYYAVREGKKKGIFTSWEECEKHIKGYYGAQYRKFNSLEEAEGFIEEVSQAENSKGKPEVIVYCDGSVPKNGYRLAKGGIGIVFGSEEYSEIFPSIYGHKVTNNIAELYSILRVFNLIIQKNEDKFYKIYSDSRYSINCIVGWSKKWMENGFKHNDGSPIKNIELIVELIRKHNIVSNKCSLEFVKGHMKGNSEKARGNNRADELARKASEQG